MTRATLVLLRHGETEDNLQHIITGQRDVGLTENGERQALGAGALIRDQEIVFHKVYSSHLRRAFRTATLALEAAEMHEAFLSDDGRWLIETRQEIAEIDSGRYTGRCYMSDLEVKWLNRIRTFDWVIPGGESEAMFVGRVRKFFEEDLLPRLKNGENVLVVAHGGVLAVFDIILGLASTPAKGDMPTSRKTPQNAAPVIYTFEDGEVVEASSVLAREPKSAAPRPKMG